MKFLFAGLALVVVVAFALNLWRRVDLWRDSAEMARLRALQPDRTAVFDPAMVAALPDPARRFLTYAIAPGTPLAPVIEITMTGRFDLGTKNKPKQLDMSARQVLAGLQGFLWQARMSGGMPVSGSDSEDWTRFWLAGLIPVARAGGDADHHRSAFGRTVAEAAIWSPVSVLPGPGIHWDALDDDTARLTVTRDGLTQSAVLNIAPDGRATAITLPRWSNVNPEHVYRKQPFGGTLSDHRDFGGLRVPAHAEVGNHFGTNDYFPFFIAEITSLRQVGR